MHAARTRSRDQLESLLLDPAEGYRPYPFPYMPPVYSREPLPSLDLLFKRHTIGWEARLIDLGVTDGRATPERDLS